VLLTLPCPDCVDVAASLDVELGASMRTVRVLVEVRPDWSVAT